MMLELICFSLYVPTNHPFSKTVFFLVSSFLLSGDPAFLSFGLLSICFYLLPSHISLLRIREKTDLGFCHVL